MGHQDVHVTGNIGSGFPDATNTGPAAAGFTGLTSYTGPDTITTASTTISGKDIAFALTISANNVTIQGCLIHAATDAPSDTPLIYISAGTTGVKVLDCEIRGENATTLQACSGVKMYGTSLEFRRNNVWQIAGDGFTLDGAASGFLITDNWLHDFADRVGVHYDGLVWGGADPSSAGVTITHNTLDMYLAGDMTATISLPATCPNMPVDHNLLGGGGYTVEGGTSYTNNEFLSGHLATYGPGAFIPAGCVWTNNTWHDGVNAGTQISKP